VRAKPNNNFLEVTVEDTGIGIDEENIPHIFDEFYRVSGPQTRYTTGTGLGLSIVKKIVESNFGRIDVESKTNKGTTFRVSFPITHD
jgi:two-component system phosphate regulon sensor histidine kinase PhoR